jgi:hypothetical protein
VRELATTTREVDPAEVERGVRSATLPSISLAVLPLVVVIAIDFLIAMLVLPRLDTAFLEERWGGTSLQAVGGVWAVATALAAAILVLIIVNRQRLPTLRQSMDVGANASVLPVVSTHIRRRRASDKWAGRPKSCAIPAGSRDRIRNVPNDETGEGRGTAVKRSPSHFQ